MDRPFFAMGEVGRPVCTNPEVRFARDQYTFALVSYTLIEMPDPSLRTDSANLYSTNLANALIHLYRAEVGKLTAYRSRLDTTTNWAVVTTAGLASFSFSNPASGHVIFILAMVTNYYFLYLEARRFRNYEIAHHRVRIMERFFYPSIMGESVDDSWHRVLLSELEKPHSPLTRAESMGWRLRRNYLWIYFGILVAWVLKVDSQRDPDITYNPAERMELASIGHLPGWIVFSVVLISYLLMVQLSLKAPRDYPLIND